MMTYRVLWEHRARTWGLQSKERESRVWKPSRPKENMHQAQGGRKMACAAVVLSVKWGWRGGGLGCGKREG